MGLPKTALRISGGGAVGRLASTAHIGAFPPGTVLAYAGALPPGGWVLCDGSSYATATYPALFAVIGYTHGGAGSTFNVPDLRGRSLLGAGNGPGLSSRTLASSGGEEDHVLTPSEVP